MSAENPSTPRKTRGFNKDGTPRKVRQKADTKEPKAMSQDANQDDEPKVEEQVRRRGTGCGSTQLT